ncbi:MAG: DNA-binding protein [Bacteroidetes bacterium]|nr:DNA-binding protein [Bacteroidota bacterium]
MQTTINDYFTRKEAAQYIKEHLGYGTPKTLAFWACKKKDKLKVRKLGGHKVRYRKSDLDKFIEETLEELFAP